MININPGCSQQLKESCRALKDYMTFVDKVRSYREEIGLEAAVERAIAECIQEEVMADFLRKHRAEVRSVCIFEYDEERHIQMERREAMEEGMKVGKDAGLRAGMEAGKEAGLREGMEAGKEAGLREGMEAGEKAGKESGLKEGLKAGIRSLIETCRELGASGDVILEKLQEKFALTEEEALAELEGCVKRMDESDKK